MKINEVAKLTGVTVRTLHYYDEIGLLKPSRITDAGYRIYDMEALATLQQILFFRELEFSLSDIKEIMANEHYDKAEALQKQKELLIQKRDRLDGLIHLLEKTMRGDMKMSFKEFDMSNIEKSKRKYADEVKERWGDTEAYRECEEKTSGYDKQQWEMLGSEGVRILKAFGEKRLVSPDSAEAQELVQKWQDYITANFFHCTKEILAGLGIMYIHDERFTMNIDKNGEGTAEFMANAIAIYCGK